MQIGFRSLFIRLLRIDAVLHAVGLSPVGEWELALPDTKDDGGQTRDYFKNEEIEDMLFVITYAGRTSEWAV